MEDSKIVPSIPFIELGSPIRLPHGHFRRVCDLNAVKAFLKFYKRINCFESVYRFSSWDDTNKKPVYESFIFDRLMFEQECHDCNYLCPHTIEVTRKLITVFMNEFLFEKKDIILQFSGNKSIYVIVLFSPINVKRTTPKLLIEEIEKVYKVGHICKGARCGSTQMKRIVGSIHSKTGLYSILLDYDMIWETEPIS